MNSSLAKKIIIPIIATFGLLIVIAWMAGLFSQKVAPNKITPAHESTHQVIQVDIQTSPKYESIPAGIRARETTLVASRIIARIDKIHVRAGDLVAKGQVLITLENSALQAQIAQAKARVNSIQALQEEAQLSLNRMQILKQKGIASNSDLEKAQANFSRLNSDLQVANQSEKEALATLGYSQIVSPINGRVVDRSAEPGNMAAPGETLRSLYNPLSLLVEANVRESLAVKVQIGQKIIVKLDALNQSVEGVISERVPAGDPNARSFIIKANIQFDKALLPGMFARMEIENGSIDQILIPIAYVHNYGQLDMVWVNDNKQLSRRFVRVGERYSDNIVIVSGLLAGEEIVLSGR
jgi:membrane fusion protein (multidrug efflux system)